MPLLKNGRAVLLVTAASIALLPAPLMAQTDATAAPVAGGLLGRITYFATRLPRALEDVPATVTVIDGEDIEAQGISDMQQLTRYVPGLTVNRQINAAQPFNDFDGFNMRGVGGNRVLMMVDGSRDYLDMNFTRQAEVVRGPGSVLWGADALGGVVALRTIDPEDVLQGRQRGGTARIGFNGFNRESNAAATFAQRFSDSLSVLVGYSRLQAREPRLSRARRNGGLYCDILGGCPSRQSL
ncbi:MAG: TonB-dependent receptor plug domain-containing protein [Pararhodobacter sp.]|nr:TonB-dependent receptor plug domain-containing protein [Pararhodobacter sp.]